MTTPGLLCHHPGLLYFMFTAAVGKLQPGRPFNPALSSCRGAGLGVCPIISIPRCGPQAKNGAHFWFTGSRQHPPLLLGQGTVTVVVAASSASPPSSSTCQMFYRNPQAQPSVPAPFEGLLREVLLGTLVPVPQPRPGLLEEADFLADRSPGAYSLLWERHSAAWPG